MTGNLKKATMALAAVLLTVPFAQAATTTNTAQSKKGLTKLEQEVRHELVMLPWLGVFDNLEFQVNGPVVVLTGQVTRPTLKTDAQRVVERIEGVEKVINNVEVLPLSPFDDQIRMATYRSIYGFGPLSRYGRGPVPPIHIIVKNGNVTLTGIVANEADRNLANMRANMVSGVFSVSNSLRLDNQA